MKTRLQFLEAMRKIYGNKPRNELSAKWTGLCRAWDLVRWFDDQFYLGDYTSELPEWFKTDVGWELRQQGFDAGYLTHYDLPNTETGIQQRIAILDRLIKKYRNQTGEKDEVD